MWFKDEAIKMLQDEVGLDPATVERQDIYHHIGYKAKLHRAIPEAGYTAELEFEDDTPLEDALGLFEEGIRLTRQVQVSLSEAEQKVRLLMEEDGEPISQELDADD